MAAKEGIRAVLEGEESLSAKMYTSGIGSSVALLTSIVLPAADWVGEESPYSQIVHIEGTTKRSQIDMQPSVEQVEALKEKVLAFTVKNNDGIITVYAIGDKPTDDYVFQATIMEVIS